MQFTYLAHDALIICHDCAQGFADLPDRVEGEDRGNRGDIW